MQKVQQIFDSQLEESVYRKYCKVVIDNNGTVEEARKQIDLAITNMENE
jgi:dephospho-CoA kinase